MNWICVLTDLYEKNEDIAGEVSEISKGNGNVKKYILLPISHSTALAQIDVTIDIEGRFIKANLVDKADAATIIPVTEGSGCRTNKPVPHPLCDNLKYLAGDYKQYFSAKKEDKKENDLSACNVDYIESLRRWCSSPYSHPKATAILKYVEKSTLIADLITNKVILPDEDGKYSDKVILQNSIPQANAFVRFRVESVQVDNIDLMLPDKSGRFRPEVWLDHTLQQSFINYYKSLEHRKALCYLTGDYTHVSDLHPKKIRNEGDGTKLISSNDDINFTFRGRFENKGEAFAIGYEASQKAHNALKWIIRKQGYTRDGLCIVVWESNLMPVISPFGDATELADDRFESDTEQPRTDTNYMGARDFNAAINGYKSKLDNTSNMFIMALDAATPGRLSITYFKELSTSSYLENIIYWHESCSWLHEKIIDKKLYRFEGMVNLDDIALLLYGTERDGWLELKTNSDGKSPMKISTFNRLLPCIIDRKKIPDDIVRTAIQRAASTAFYEPYNWQRILTLACSLVRKQRFEKEEWGMALNTESKERSYLYGRLLAVAERIEYLTYERNETRQTNAKRFMNAFSQRPFRTWKIIEERIQPHLNKLSTGQRIHYSRLLDDIYDKFIDDEFRNNSKLDGLYLLGYHNQAHSFNNYSPDQKEEEKEE